MKPRTVIDKALQDRVAGARRVLAITGAGISAESGIATFRGPDGWWRGRDPMTLASPEGFAADPRLVWEWYLERRASIRAAEPNPAHLALARLEGRLAGGGGELLVATQNVDGLHQRAGSRAVAEVHGSIWTVLCTATGRRYREGEVTVEGGPVPPVGPEGALLRPGVVWFGEALPEEPIERIETFLADPPDLALVIGTSALFGYIVGWALRARAAGATLIEINPERTELSFEADYFLQGKAGEILPSLID